MTHFQSYWHVALFVVSLVLVQPRHTVSAADAAPLPRYHLEVGQELNYKGESEFNYKAEKRSGGFADRSEWKVSVVRKNEDGSSRVVIRSTEVSRKKGKDVGKPRSTLAYCDIFDDGRIIANPSLGFHFDPSTLFPRLPGDRKELATGWENLRENDNGRSSFKLVSQPSSGADILTIDEVKKSPLDEIYLSTNASTITFDPKRGLVVKVKGENSQGWGLKGKGTDSRELVSVEHRDAAWLKQLSDQADHYFKISHAYEQKTEQAGKDVKNSKKLLEEAQALLTAADKTITVPAIKEQLDQQLKSHKLMAGWIAEAVADRAKVVGKPAPSWDLTDLKGKSHSLKDYRGKVMVLDFWYRGCGWCMRAMPQVKQLAAEFRGQPVAVLGMCVDKDEADAKFVVDKMRLDYGTLKSSRDLAKKYGVQGYPTLVIIDRQGAVHDFHVGYSPTLQQDVGQIVRDLLAKK